MKTRIIVAAVAIPILFVIMFFLPPVYMGFLTAIICGFAAFEFMTALSPNMQLKNKVFTIAAAALIPLTKVTAYPTALTMAVIILYAVVVFVDGIITYGGEKDIQFKDIAYGFFIGIVYPMMLSSLVMLKDMYLGKYLVLLPVVVTFCCDSGAYFAGVYFGRHKVTPRVSPNKSAEGFIGGVLTGIVCMFIYCGIVALATDIRVNFWAVALYGILGSVVVEIGDLAFSLIKRLVGIKDYGKLIPGHGGMLDRFDSMSFAAPVMYVLSVILPVFRVF